MHAYVSQNASLESHALPGSSKLCQQVSCACTSCDTTRALLQALAASGVCIHTQRLASDTCLECKRTVHRSCTDVFLLQHGSKVGGSSKQNVCPLRTDLLLLPAWNNRANAPVSSQSDSGTGYVRTGCSPHSPSRKACLFAPRPKVHPRHSLNCSPPQRAQSLLLQRRLTTHEPQCQPQRSVSQSMAVSMCSEAARKHYTPHESHKSRPQRAMCKPLSTVHAQLLHRPGSLSLQHASIIRHMKATSHGHREQCANYFPRSTRNSCTGLGLSLQGTRPQRGPRQNLHYPLPGVCCYIRMS